MSASIRETLGLEKSSTSVEVKKAKPKQAPTVRLELTLGQSNADVFPEFSYARLVEQELSSRKSERDDPFGEDNDLKKISEIARRMEDKYGVGGAVKSKKRKRAIYDEDLVDISSGYDDSDPFVDNSEAFDEYVPDGYEPQLGGFYINDGDLFFKLMSDDDDSRSMQLRDDSDFVSPKKEKRVKIGDKLREKPREHHERGRGRGRGGGAAGLTHKSLVKSPKRPDGTVPTRGRPRKILATQISGPRPAAANGSGSQAAATTTTSAISTKNISTAASSVPPPPSSPPAAAAGLASDGRQPIASPKKKMSVTSPTLSAGSAGSMSDDAMDMPPPSGGFKMDMDGMGDEGAHSSEDTSQSAITELPDGLPADLVQYIQNFERRIKDGSIETANVKNLDSTYDSMLLEIETKLHNRVKGKNRQAVFSYLSSFLPHSKDSLQRRAKKVNIANEEAMLEGPLARLHEAVQLQMPEQMERYKEEVRRAVEAHDSKSSHSSSDDNPSAASESWIGSGGEEDADTSLINALDSTTAYKPSEEGKPKKFRPPPKRFMWTQETRQLLYEAVKAKVDGLRATMQRIVGAIESIKQFLDQRVKAIWPDSWMSLPTLYRESRPAHLAITNPPLFKQQAQVAAKGHKGSRLVRKPSKTCPASLLMRMSSSGSQSGNGGSSSGSMSSSSLPPLTSAATPAPSSQLAAVPVATVKPEMAVAAPFSSSKPPASSVLAKPATGTSKAALVHMLAKKSGSSPTKAASMGSAVKPQMAVVAGSNSAPRAVTVRGGHVGLTTAPILMAVGTDKTAVARGGGHQRSASVPGVRPPPGIRSPPSSGARSQPVITMATMQQKVKGNAQAYKQLRRTTSPPPLTASAGSGSGKQVAVHVTRAAVVLPNTLTVSSSGTGGAFRKPNRQAGGSTSGGRVTTIRLDSPPSSHVVTSIGAGVAGGKGSDSLRHPRTANNTGSSKSTGRSAFQPVQSSAASAALPSQLLPNSRASPTKSHQPGSGLAAKGPSASPAFPRSASMLTSSPKGHRQQAAASAPPLAGRPAPSPGALTAMQPQPPSQPSSRSSAWQSGVQSPNHHHHQQQQHHQSRR